MTDEVVPAPWPGEAVQRRAAAARQESALQLLRQAIGDLDVQRAELAAAGDYETLAHGGADVAALIADLGILLSQVRRDVAVLLDALPRENRRAKPRAMVAGLGMVEVDGGTEWKGWESERLLRDLVVRALLVFTGLTPAEWNASEDGDYVDESVGTITDAVCAVLLDCLPVTESLGWRRGQKQPDGTYSGLRGQGIDLDDYAERTAKPRLAKFPKR